MTAHGGKRAGAGRPTTGSARTLRAFRLSDEEHAILERLAERDGVSTAEALRGLLQREQTRLNRKKKSRG